VSKYAPETAQTYRPSAVDELSPREIALLQAGLHEAQSGLQDTWTSFLGRGATLAAPALTTQPQDSAADCAVHRWHCGAWRGDAQMPPRLEQAIAAAACGFDAVEGEAVALTALETAILQTVLTATLRSLASDLALGQMTDITWRPGAGPGQAQSVWIATDARVGPVRGTIRWSLPMSMVRRAPEPQRKRDQERLWAMLRSEKAQVEICAVGPEMTVAEIADLEPGDVVLLGQSALAEVGVIIAGRQVARAQPGAKGDRLALRITGIGPT
jgi:hypothetical protein